MEKHPLLQRPDLEKASKKSDSPLELLTLDASAEPEEGVEQPRIRTFLIDVERVETGEMDPEFKQQHRIIGRIPTGECAVFTLYYDNQELSQDLGVEIFPQAADGSCTPAQQPSENL